MLQEEGNSGGEPRGITRELYQQLLKELLSAPSLL
jgi:hypothetical protein